MTDIQAWLDHGKTLADNATEGPWIAGPDNPSMAGEKWSLRVAGKPGLRASVVEYQFGSGNMEFIVGARTRFPLALNALQAVLDMHKPRTTYPPAGEWDLAGKYIPYCQHGDDADHPDHEMIDGWFQCTTVPELVCSEEVDGDAWPWPCPTVRAIQDAIGEDQQP